MRATTRSSPPKPAHSQAPIVKTAPNASLAAAAGSKNKPVSRTKPSTHAVSTLVLSIGVGRHLRRGLAETALAPPVVFECRLQMRRRELGPQHLVEIQLGVGEIPQQEVADALLAAGAYQQIRVRYACERKTLGDLRFADVGRRQAPRCRIRAQRTAGLHEIPTAAVGDRDIEFESRVRARERLGGQHAAREFRAEGFAVPDEAQAHAVAVQIFDFANQRIEKQAHQHADLIGRPAPVLAAEGEQREKTNPGFSAILDDPAHDFDARAVSRGARQAARAGPAAVAVHDDCDMLRRDGHYFFGSCKSANAQTCINSFSLSAIAWSISATCLSVSFWMSSWARRSSS